MNNMESISSFIDILRDESTTQRCNYIKMRTMENIHKYSSFTGELKQLIEERSITNISNMLAKRRGDASTMDASIKLTSIDILPPSVTSTFINRNQRTIGGESLAKHRALYYDENSGETLICSDCEEDQVEGVNQNEVFSDSEDHILWKTITKFGLNDHVLGLIAKSFNRDADEIKERYATLVQEESGGNKDNNTDAATTDMASLDIASDSFDRLFCRRCYTFDCPTHGATDDPIFPVEKLPPWDPGNEQNVSCGQHCYKEVGNGEKLSGSSWTSLEKDLCYKGAEIFGSNSCLIAFNCLNGLKTCNEIHQYMNVLDCKTNDANCLLHGNSSIAPNTKDHKGINGGRKRSKLSSLKPSTKSAAKTPSFNEKQNSGSINDPYPHYTPCKCKTSCGEECSCFISGNCEKFCGCPKSCKNRFRGCSCSKGQCSNRQCPCFVAKRECDPDLCQNCKIGCGDGSVGRLVIEGNNHECRNMKLFLGQHQKNVSGWGAFLKNSVGKNEFLGEYTGELITYQESDKRAAHYEHIKRLYLFDLDNYYILDAYRKGNKLRFANHSSNPNIYPQVMKVAGDYRVGLHSLKKIDSGEELLLDYNYPPDLQPEWALKSEDSGQKKKKGTSSSLRKKDKAPSRIKRIG